MLRFIIATVSLALVAPISAIFGQEEIVIGEYASLTGGSASFGQSSHKGTALAIEEINAAGGVLGKKLKLITEDDQSLAGQPATIARKLISQDKAVAVLGEVASSKSLEAAPICQQSKIPMISPSSTNPKVTEIGDYIFRVCFIDPYQGKALAAFAKNSLKLDRAAILIDKKNDYSVGLAQNFRENFEKLGGKIVAEQSYSGGDTEFRPQLTAIRTASPQMLFIPGFYTEVGQIAIQTRDLGINIPLVGGDGWDSPTLIEIGGKAMDGTYFSDHYFVGDPRPLVQEFVKKIRARHGKNPEANAALGYDALQILSRAIRETGSLDEKGIRDHIASVKDYQGVSGNITMGADRNPIKPVAMIKIQNGQMEFAEWVKP
jgi:branched-chain amino acid transport system substrate-binding protein